MPPESQAATPEDGQALEATAGDDAEVEGGPALTLDRAQQTEAQPRLDDTSVAQAGQDPTSIPGAISLAAGSSSNDAVVARAEGASTPTVGQASGNGAANSCERSQAEPYSERFALITYLMQYWHRNEAPAPNPPVEKRRTRSLPWISDALAGLPLTDRNARAADTAWRHTDHRGMDVEDSDAVPRDEAHSDHVPDENAAAPDALPVDSQDDFLPDRPDEGLLNPNPAFDDPHPFGDDREEGFVDSGTFYSISDDAPLLCRRSAEDSSVNQTVVRFFNVLDGRRAAVVTEDRFGGELCDCTARHDMPDEHTIDEEVLYAPCRYLAAFRRWGSEAPVDTGTIVAHGEKVWSIADDLTDGVYVVEQTRLQTLRCNSCSGRCHHGKQVGPQASQTGAGTDAPMRQAKRLISQFDPDIGDHGDWTSSQGKRYLSTYCPRLFVGVQPDTRTLSEGSHDLIQLAFKENLETNAPLRLHRHYFRDESLKAEHRLRLSKEQVLERQRREQRHEEPLQDGQRWEEVDRQEQDQDAHVQEDEQDRHEQIEEQDRDERSQGEGDGDERGQEGQNDEQQEHHEEQDEAMEESTHPHWSHPTDTCIVYLFSHFGAAFVSVPYCTCCGCVAHDVDRLFDIYVGPLVSKEPRVAYGIPMHVVRYLTFYRMSGVTLKSVFELYARVIQSPSMVVASGYSANPPMGDQHHKVHLSFMMTANSISFKFPSEATFRRLYNVALTR